MDKGPAALANTAELQQAGIGWISALPWNQAPENPHPRHPGDVADHIGQLHIHHGQRLLHLLHHSPCLPHQPVPLPPYAPHPSDLLWRPERVSQQSIGVQFQFLPPTHPVRRSSTLPSIAAHRPNPTRLQPTRHLVQFLGPRSKLPHRILVRPTGTLTKCVLLPTSMPAAFGCTIFNSGSPWWICPCNFRFSLRCNFSPRCSRSKLDSFLFAMAHYLCFLWICQARLSWRLLAISLTGSSLAFFRLPLAAKQSIAATEVMLSGGHCGSKTLFDHSLPPGIFPKCHTARSQSFPLL